MTQKAKYRIIKRGHYYIPEEKILWLFWSGWMDFDANKNPVIVKFTYIEAAEALIKRKIAEKRKEKVKSETIWEFDKNGRLV